MNEAPQGTKRRGTVKRGAGPTVKLTCNTKRSTYGRQLRIHLDHSPQVVCFGSRNQMPLPYGSCWFISLSGIFAICVADFAFYDADRRVNNDVQISMRSLRHCDRSLIFQQEEASLKYDTRSADLAQRKTFKKNWKVGCAMQRSLRSLAT
ncbi:hypothetical protein V5799_010075 [Amblyomma americanum]|uniref:Uncharacterized protein n=1 Tax=Amblyomma americanum TaxID=6943 RepID=A0AAQ4F9Q8_AMBAM